MLTKFLNLILYDAALDAFYTGAVFRFHIDDNENREVVDAGILGFDSILAFVTIFENIFGMNLMEVF